MLTSTCAPVNDTGTGATRGEIMYRIKTNNMEIPPITNNRVLSIFNKSILSSFTI